jgi:hypothetical protein
MRAIMRACALAAIVALGSVMGAGAAPVGTGLAGAVPRESAVELAGYDSRYSYCEWMRRGCIYREAWGQIGETTCQRYHTNCTGGSSYCERLRQGCIHKSEWDEVGQGNCRRYRAHCGGDGMTYCQRLRHNCIHGWGYGEGSCRRFVRECS